MHGAEALGFIGEGRIWRHDPVLQAMPSCKDRTYWSTGAAAKKSLWAADERRLTRIKRVLPIGVHPRLSAAQYFFTTSDGGGSDEHTVEVGAPNRQTASGPNPRISSSSAFGSLFPKSPSGNSVRIVVSSRLTRS
jgi:hypothetical protein